MDDKRIYLIGYMGCGKTNIGKHLAYQLGMQFIDMDAFIENRLHRSIDAIFTEEGEAHFRLLEQKTLKELSEFENVVISTGGGTPCYFDNMDVMLSTGHTIYLKTSPDTLSSRLSRGQYKRPVIKGKSQSELKEYIESSLRQRETYYLRANYIYNTEALLGRRDIISSVDHLVSLLSNEEHYENG